MDQYIKWEYKLLQIQLQLQTSSYKQLKEIFVNKRIYHEDQLGYMSLLSLLSQVMWFLSTTGTVTTELQDVKWITVY